MHHFYADYITKITTTAIKNDNNKRKSLHGIVVVLSVAVSLTRRIQYSYGQTHLRYDDTFNNNKERERRKEKEEEKNETIIISKIIVLKFK